MNLPHPRGPWDRSSMRDIIAGRGKVTRLGTAMVSSGSPIVCRCQSCYRVALVVAGECVLRYDNETGKGDHRHVGDVETSYSFSSYETLLADFWSDVDAWRQRR